MPRPFDETVADLNSWKEPALEDITTLECAEHMCSVSIKR